MKNCPPNVEEQYELTQRIVGSMVPYWKSPALEKEDLYQEAMCGLTQKMQHWPSSNPWKPWATQIIFHATVDAFRRHDPLSRNDRRTLKVWREAETELASALKRFPAVEEVASHTGIGVGKYRAALRREELSSLLFDQETEDGEETLLSCVPSNDLSVEDEVMGRQAENIVSRFIGEHFKDRDADILRDVFLNDMQAIQCTHKYGLSKSRVSQIIAKFKELAANSDPYSQLTATG